MMATVGTSSVVEPLDAKRRWVYKTTQNDDLIAAALIKHMQKAGVKNVGFIGFNDPYGENWLKVFGGPRREGRIRSCRRRALQPHRPKRDRTGVEGHFGEARRGARRRRRRPRRVAAGHAARPGLQGNDLPDAWRSRPTTSSGSARTRSRERCSPRVRCSSSTRSPDANPVKRVARELHRRVRKAVRAEAGDVRREHLGCGSDPRARDPHGAWQGEAGYRGVPNRAARRDRAGARGRRLPGRIQHEPDEPQRHGRTCAGARDREGRQVPAVARVSRATRRVRSVIVAAGSGNCVRANLQRRCACTSPAFSSPPARRSLRRRPSCLRRYPGVAMAPALAHAVGADAAQAAQLRGAPRRGRRRAARRRRVARPLARATGARVVVAQRADEGLGASLAAGVGGGAGHDG